MRPFLSLQLRPGTEASGNEFAAIMEKAGFHPGDTHRVQLHQQSDLEGHVLDDKLARRDHPDLFSDLFGDFLTTDGHELSTTRALRKYIPGQALTFTEYARGSPDVWNWGSPGIPFGGGELG